MANNNTYEYSHYNDCSNLNKERILYKYTQDINQLKYCGKLFDISDEEIDNILQESFGRNTNGCINRKLTFLLSMFKKVIIYVGFSVFIVTLLYYVVLQHSLIATFILRNIQGLIYPVLKVWRKMSLPVIETYPSLTELYEESCLFHNPLFEVQDMDCWPCEQTLLIPDLSSLDATSIQRFGVPYIVKTNQLKVPMNKLVQFYKNNSIILRRDAPRVKSSNGSIKTLDELLTLNRVQNLQHHVWRINRMSAGRTIRTLFPRPVVVPQLGQSTERFVLIWDSGAPLFRLPDTECSVVFVVQAYGQRNYILQPSPECTGRCKPVSVLLKQSYVLVYSWWYWRPLTASGDYSASESIAFMSSYC